MNARDLTPGDLVELRATAEDDEPWLYLVAAEDGERILMVALYNDGFEGCFGWYAKELTSGHWSRLA